MLVEFADPRSMEEFTQMLMWMNRLGTDLTSNAYDREQGVVNQLKSWLYTVDQATALDGDAMGSREERYEFRMVRVDDLIRAARKLYADRN